MTDKQTIKTTIVMTLERLNQSGTVIASANDAAIALRKAQESKVQEAFRAIFNSLTLEELSMADAVIADMFPKPVPAQSQTPPPVTGSVSPIKKRK